jgi:transcriptional regulator with XRE-family HTH domain
MPKTLFTHRHDQLRALLIDARKRAGLRQVDLAAALGRPQSFVSKYESGERRLDVVEFIDVTEAIGTEAANIVAEMQRNSPKRKHRKAVAKSGPEAMR